MASKLTKGPILRPYVGVGDNFFQRHAWLIVTLVTCILCVPYGFLYATTTPWFLVPALVPPLIVVALVIWALPDGSVSAERYLSGIFTVFFIGFVIWPNYVAIQMPGLPWITFSRIVGSPMTLLLLISVSASPEFRRRIFEVLTESSLIWKILLIFIAQQAISIPFSNNIGDSIARFILSQFTQTAPLFVCCYVFRTPGRFLKLVDILWGLAAFICAMAILEFVRKKVLWAGFVPSFLTPHDEVVGRIMAGTVREATGQYRAQGVFTTSLGLAEFLALATPFVIHIAVVARTSPLRRWLAGLSVPLFAVVILLTDSRLGLLGIFLAVAFYAVLWCVQEIRTRRSELVPTAVLVAYPVLLTLFIIASLTVGRIRAKVWGTGQYASSNEARAEQWAMGIPKINSHPLGNGTGTAGAVLGYTTPSGFQTIDSYMLAVALDTGWLGLLTFITLFGLGIHAAISTVITRKGTSLEIGYLAPLGICCLVFLSVKTVFAQDDIHPLMYIVLGVIMALKYRQMVVEKTADPAGRETSAGAGFSKGRPATSSPVTLGVTRR